MDQRKASPEFQPVPDHATIQPMDRSVGNWEALLLIIAGIVMIILLMQYADLLVALAG